MGNQLATVDKIDSVVDAFLSNFKGDSEQLYAFDGGINSMVDFAGSSKEDMTRRAFSIELKNDNASPKSVFLLPSMAKSAMVLDAGTSKLKGRLYEGANATIPIEGLAVGETAISVASTNDVQEFVENFLFLNPGYVACFRLSSNVPSAYTGKMLVETYNPFDESKFNTDKTIRLSQYQRGDYLKDNFIDVTEGFEANSQKRVRFTIPANSICTFELYFALILNPAKGLANEVSKAKGHRGNRR